MIAEGIPYVNKSNTCICQGSFQAVKPWILILDRCESRKFAF